MNRKGQALIEFVLVLPVLILILFVIVDFGNIFHTKLELQNQSADIIRLIQNNNDEENIKNTYSKLKLDIKPYQEKFKKITITKEVPLMSPVLDRVLGSKYKIVVERILPNEETEQ